MKNIQSLDSKTLLLQTRSLVAEERRITLALIEHLEEIQRRRGAKENPSHATRA